MICTNIEELNSELKKYQKNKIVFTNGCFDIIHTGHISYLKKAKSFGDCLVVGLNNDASVKRLKGESRPINNQEDRAIVLNELKSVDYVIYFCEDTPFNLISEIKPFIIAKGGDYKENQVVGRDIVNSYGGRVEIIKFIEGKSSSSIINKMELG